MKKLFKNLKKLCQSKAMNKKVIAFTLAETLIVMGIIGIVSALTLPNLNSSTGEKEKVAKVKKIYSNLNDAVGRAIAVYGPVDEWIQGDTTKTAQVTRFGERIAEFMKVSKNCGVTTSGTCFGSKFSNSFTGTNGIDNVNTFYKFVLADGTPVAIEYDTSYSSLNAVWFLFDIDGANKGRGALGEDLFSFHYDLSDLTLSANGQDTPYISAVATGKGEDATAWVINYDNMDYLKVSGVDGKCKNSNVTLNAFANPPVTSCK